MADMWAEVRRDFPALERYAYLNAAAGSPTPRPVREAVESFHRQQEQSGDRAWKEWQQRKEQIRESVARFVGAEAEEIAFTPNTSIGLNLAIDLLEDAQGVLTDELEFPTVTLPWIHRGMKAHFVEAPGGVLRAEHFAAESTPPADVIAVSHVQFSNGCRLDLEALGALKGSRRLVVSGSQSVGVFPVDVRRCRVDALASAGHKWLCAGYGTGFVYVSRELIRERSPRSIGWLGVEHPFRFDNREYRLLDSNRRTEIGCPSFPTIFALGAAVEYVSAIGIDAIAARALALNELLTDSLLRQGLEVLSPGGAQRSAETLVRVREPLAAVARLHDLGVVVTPKREGVRVSTHFYNDEHDVERCVRGLASFAAV